MWVSLCACVFLTRVQSNRIYCNSPTHKHKPSQLHQAHFLMSDNKTTAVLTSKDIAQRQLCWFSGLTVPTVGYGGLSCGGSLSHQSPQIFFNISHLFSHQGKVAMQSSLERKINRLAVHRNATTVPLGTSVCVVLDHSGLSVQL